MRTIELHQDPNIIIEADERDPAFGNSSHSYIIKVACADETGFGGATIVVPFQHGPLGERGINGVTNEALIAIVIDRLAGFQSGEWPCEENEAALVGLEKALAALLERTRKRVDRGVEGTSAK